MITPVLMDHYETIKTILFWSFGPKYASNFLLSIYYKLAKKPTNQTTLAKHFKIAYVTCVLTYLAYSLISVDLHMPSNYYSILGLSPSATEVEIKTSYRTLSKLFHPDKLLNYPEFAQLEMTEEYSHMQRAYKVLKTPLSRLMYDKLGPAVCDRCRTKRDYLEDSILPLVIFYVVNLFMVSMFFLMGISKFGTFWRCTALFFLASIEGFVILKDVVFFKDILFWRTPHEQLVLLHQFYTILTISTAQLGPVLFDSSKLPSIQENIDLVESYASLIENESINLIKDGFEPFKNDEVALTLLERRMGRFAVEVMVTHNDKEIGESRMRVSERLISSKKRK